MSSSNQPPSAATTTTVVTRSRIQDPLVIEIDDGFFIGNLAAALDLPTLQKHSITSLVSVLRDAKGKLKSDYPAYRRQIPRSRRLHIPCDDKQSTNLLVQFGSICDFIDAQLANPVPVIPDRPFEPGKPKEYFYFWEPTEHDRQNAPKIPAKVLVHCHAGISRSATVVMAYLMRKKQQPFREVWAQVKSKRRLVNPNDGFLEQLKIWDEVGYEIWQDKEKRVPKEPYRAFLERQAKGLLLEEELFSVLGCTIKREIVQGFVLATVFSSPPYSLSKVGGSLGPLSLCFDLRTDGQRDDLDMGGRTAFMLLC